MDFTHTPEQTEAATLAATILKDRCTPERLRAVDAAGAERFDADLWGSLAGAGLVALALPEEYDGSGLGFLEACSVILETGRVVAPVPLASHVVGALAVAELGSDALRKEWLNRAATGETILTTAFNGTRADGPTVRAVRDGQRDGQQDGDGWRLDGTADLVGAGTLAGLLLVPAATADGPVVLAVEAGAAGVLVEPQRVTDGDLAARVTFRDVAVAADRSLTTADPDDTACAWLDRHWSVALCALQQGIVEGALALTASYAKTREQFGRPIGTFQAVSQRLADGYIDVLGSRLMLWQAAWRLAEGLPADVAVASARLWACDTGHRLAHTTVHVHGGVGVDLDGEAHRYFSAAKRTEFLLGGTNEQARLIGSALAEQPT